MKEKASLLNVCLKASLPRGKRRQLNCINLEGWDGKGDGREVQKGGDICSLEKWLFKSFVLFLNYFFIEG